MSIVFERFAAERKSSEWLAARAVADNSKYLVLNSHGDLFLNGQEIPENLFFSKQEVRSYFPEKHIEIFLGSEGSHNFYCLGRLLYTSPSPRDATLSRMPACG